MVTGYKNTIDGTYKQGAAVEISGRSNCNGHVDQAVRWVHALVI
jgi:hypothetical protein